MTGDEDPLERRSDKPMHGERRPLAPAVLGVVGLVVAVVLVVALMTWLRYTT